MAGARLWVSRKPFLNWDVEYDSIASLVRCWVHARQLRRFTATGRCSIQPTGGLSSVRRRPDTALRPLLERELIGFEQRAWLAPLKILPSPTVTVMFQLADQFPGTPRAF